MDFIYFMQSFQTTNLLRAETWPGRACPPGRTLPVSGTACRSPSSSGADTICSCPTTPSWSRRTPLPRPAGWWWAVGSRSPSSPSRTCWPAMSPRTQKMPFPSTSVRHDPTTQSRTFAPQEQTNPRSENWRGTSPHYSQTDAKTRGGDFKTQRLVLPVRSAARWSSSKASSQTWHVDVLKSIVLTRSKVKVDNAGGKKLSK